MKRHGFLIGGFTGMILVVAMQSTMKPAKAQEAIQEGTVQMVVPCEMNLENGRITVDGKFLPKVPLVYYVARYDHNFIQDGWSHGLCYLNVTHGITY